MAFLKKKKRLAERPYWLTGFEVLCAACEGPHAHAVTIRCPGCDRPICPTCAVHIAREALCADCGPAGSAKPRSGRERRR